MQLYETGHSSIVQHFSSVKVDRADKTVITQFLPFLHHLSARQTFVDSLQTSGPTALVTETFASECLTITGAERTDAVVASCSMNCGSTVTIRSSFCDASCDTWKAFFQQLLQTRVKNWTNPSNLKKQQFLQPNGPNLPMHLLRGPFLHVTVL